MQLPTIQKIQKNAGYYLVAGITFALVYGVLNYWTAQRPEKVRLYLDWEVQLPFIPGFIYGYLSVILLFLLPLCSLTERQIRALCVAFVTATIVAGAIYFVLPAELAHQRPAMLPEPQLLYGILYTLALPHNLFPSLHITYSTLILLAIANQEANTAWSTIAVVWMLIIVLSVVLIRQHQLIDIAGGWLLGWLTYRFVYQPLSKSV